MYDTRERLFQMVAFPNLSDDRVFAFGVPSFSGDDDYVVYQSLTDTNGFAFRIDLDADYVVDISTIKSLNNFDVALPFVQRNQVRDITRELISDTAMLDFGSLREGESETTEVALTNVGNAVLEITSIVRSTDSITHNLTNRQLLPNETVRFSITASLSVSSPILADTLTIQHTGTNQTVEISLLGFFGSDFDSDGIADTVDEDDDNDGTLDVDDVFPLDATETLDTDGDGIGNNADTDDDDDGLTDVDELSAGLDPLNPFDAAGPSEILWRHAESGQNTLWTMESHRLVEVNEINSVPDSNWKVAGMADFTDDGMDEILFRHQSRGENRLWTIEGGIRKSSLAVRGAHPNWFVTAMDDFDEDGDADLMWRNRVNGANRYWEMDGNTRRSSLAVRTVALNWEVVGSGDFDGDGHSDLMWRDKNSGANIVWLMQGESVMERGALPTVHTNWKVVGIGDFDGDGMDDLLWRNEASGANSIWLLNGVTRKSRASIPEAILVWNSFGVFDMNSDGMADIHWRNNSTGLNRLWLMNGTTRTSSLPIEALRDLNWEPVAVGNVSN